MNVAESTTAPAWPSLEQAEHEQHVQQTLVLGHQVQEGMAMGIGALRPLDSNITDRLKVLDANTPTSATNDLDAQLLLAQERVAQIEERLAALQANRAALQKEADAARAALDQAEADMRQAALDQKEAARQFASHGNAGLLAAKARHGRAVTAAEKATADLDMLAEALEVAHRDLQAAGAERHRRAQALWRAISARAYQAAGDGIRHLARAWAARSKSGDGSMTMTQFVAMSFQQVLPNVEAQAGIERQLSQEHFPQ